MCTGIRLKADDGSILYGRTMEFGKETNSDIIIIPRNYSFTGTAPDQSEGLSWKTRYAVVGANMLNLIGIVDGVNEKGLAGGLFYFPQYANYQHARSDQYTQTIAPWELLTWLLTNYATLAEIQKALPLIHVTNTVFTPWGCVPPLHAIVHDTTGQSLVIEYVEGKLITYLNPLGVITNAPTFEWHLINLKNYLQLSPYNISVKQLNGITLSPFGQGSGMLGLPGDFTPPSRFIRAVAFSHNVIPTKTADDARDAAFHILNLFNIPLGIMRENSGRETVYDYTQWTTVSDLPHKRYYWTTYHNNQLHMVDLTKSNLDHTEPIIISMQQTATIRDLTPQT